MNGDGQPLYVECGKCEGQGSWTPPPELRGGSATFFGSRECPDCDGLGVLLSPMGSQIMDLVRRLRRSGRI